MNESLIDPLLRHQINLEGYKNTVAEENEDYTLELITILLALIYKTGKDSLGDLTKREMITLIAEFNKRARKVISRVDKIYKDTSRKFLAADLAILNKLYARYADRKPARLNVDRLWATLSNDIVPGIGIEPKNMVKSLFASILAELNIAFKKSFANDTPVKAFAKELLGTATNKHKDGVLNKLGNQARAVTNTLLQYISTYLSSILGGLFFEKYKWVSILDSRTTDICRNRNGNIYNYGNGPMPPAHYNCRSMVVPVISDNVTEPDTLFAWLKTQPRNVLASVLGASGATKAVRDGLKASDIPTTKDFPKLTLNQFKGKNLDITN